MLSEANERFDAKLFVGALVKKVFECQESFIAGITLYKELILK